MRSHSVIDEMELLVLVMAPVAEIIARNNFKPIYKMLMMEDTPEG